MQVAVDQNDKKPQDNMDWSQQCKWRIHTTHEFSFQNITEDVYHYYESNLKYEIEKFLHRNKFIYAKEFKIIPAQPVLRLEWGKVDIDPGKTNFSTHDKYLVAR